MTMAKTEYRVSEILAIENFFEREAQMFSPTFEPTFISSTLEFLLRGLSDALILEENPAEIVKKLEDLLDSISGSSQEFPSIADKIR